MKICSLALIAACALLVPVGSSAASTKYCGTTRVESDHVVRVSVRVYRGTTTCRTARRLARKIYRGDCPYVNNGFGYNSYSRCGNGWRGDIGTGAWGMRQQSTGAQIGGRERYQ